VPSFVELIALTGPGYLAAVAVPLSIIDVKQRRLPNRIVLPGLLVSLVCELIAAGFSGEWMRLGSTVLGSLAVFALGYWFNHLGAMGMGDVKLLTLIALIFGWWSWSALGIALLAGFGSAVAVTSVQLIWNRTRMTQTIPLGPYLLFGCLASATSLVWS
jgi:leader peptidase (prepilin peptidase)/N-methyltransferase